MCPNCIAWTGKRLNQKTKKANIKKEMLTGDNNTRQKIHYWSLNYLHEHLLSYYTVNLCTHDTGVSSINPSPCSARQESAAWHYWLLSPPASESSSIPGFHAGQECISGREKRICSPLSCKHHVRPFKETHWASSPCPETSPLPSHKPRIILSNFGYGPGLCILFSLILSFIRHFLPFMLLQEKGLG